MYLLNHLVRLSLWDKIYYMLLNTNQSNRLRQNTRYFKESEEMRHAAITMLERLQNKEEKR